MYLNVVLDFQDIPQYLVTNFNVPSLWLAGLLATIVFLGIIMIPFTLRGLSGIGIMFGGLVAVLCVGLGWLDSWIIIINIMLVVGLFTFGLMKKV